MAHRGRLNVLVNLLGKSPAALFSEFEGKYDLSHLQGSGDVKYHKGFSADLRTAARQRAHRARLQPLASGGRRPGGRRLGARPPGAARRRARASGCCRCSIHGDAAFAGQGVVMETLQLSQARGFYTGGTVHVIINNQVGFTTSEPRDARSTIYCSDVAKMLEAPIFHVNADDPEAVVFVTRLALEYRMRFHKDVVIDLVCYRRHGHNEADEPAATQPVMYRVIRQHPTARQLYADQLVAAGVAARRPMPTQMLEQYRDGLDEGRPQARASLGMIGNKYTVDWSALRAGRLDRARADRRRACAPARRSASASSSCRQDFTLHPRVAQVIANRKKMLAGELPLDWGCAETLAYASLLEDGFSVRISRPGQRPRHLLPSARGAARSEHRRDVRAAAAHRGPSSRGSRSSTRCSPRRR